MKLSPKPPWLLVALAILFGAVSLGFGFYLLSISPLLGIVGILFGVMDLIAAVLYWKTGRLSWFILLLGPVVFIPAMPIPVLLPGIATLFMVIFPLLFIVVTIAIFFWMSGWLTRKVAAPVAYGICRRCGAAFPQDYRYCPFCGEPVKPKT